MNIVQVSVDDKNLKRRMNRIISKLDSNSKVTVDEIGKLGRDMIMFNMPRNSGEARQSITYKTEIHKTGYHSTKIYQWKIAHADRYVKSGFNLVYWMFVSNKALSHFRTGNIQAMRDTPKTLRGVFRRRVELDINKALK